MMNILVTIPNGQVKDTFIPPDVAQRLSSIGTVTWNNEDSQYRSAELKEKLAGMNVCITGWGSACFDESVLKGADSLKLVAHTGGSVSPIVSPAFFEKGLKIVSGNRLYAESVAEGVIAYILCALRELPFHAGEMQAKRWSSDRSYNEGLLDQCVGLVGFGMVARYLVKMLEPFRVKIKACDPHVPDDVLMSFGVERASLDEIVSQSKVLSIHAARVPETYHMISRELLKTIRDGALLVNTARGNLIDEEALADELATGRFKAILDVYEKEPLPETSRLRGMRNVILIPHMAGPTVDRRRVVTLALIDDILKFFEGKPLQNEIGRDYALAMTR